MDPQQEAANREAILNRLLGGGRLGPTPVASHPPPLEDDDETAFQQWYAKAAKQFQLDPNPDNPRHFYDYRGAYKAGAYPDASKHWPSEFKLEGHPDLIVGGRDTRTGKPIVNPVASHPARDAVILESTRGNKRRAYAQTERAKINETPQISLGEMRSIGPETNPETRAELHQGVRYDPTLDPSLEAMQQLGFENMNYQLRRGGGGALSQTPAGGPLELLSSIPLMSAISSKLGKAAAPKAAAATAKAASAAAAAARPATIEMMRVPTSSPPDMGALAERLFPKLDAYGKPAGLLSKATMLKRVEAAADLSPETKAALADLAEQVGARRVVPAEVHAIASGQPYKPGRTIRRAYAVPEGAKPRPGAPFDVTTARQEGQLRDRYLAGVERGVGGRDWYHDSGQAIRFYANDDPLRANLFAGDLAITSPATSVDVNSGFGVKGYNQATAGVPVQTGRFPTAMSKAIEESHAAGAAGDLGLKRTPFQQNLARGGGFLQKTDPPRAVHDIWDAEGWGFMNPDATPMRVGFGPAQHRWMDRQQDKVIATANERALGGFTDWEELRTQAAQWTGQQIKAGVLDPKDAAKSFADQLAKLAAQGSRETMPGRSTGHLPQLFDPGMEDYRQLLHDIMLKEGGIYDPQMRDQIAAGYGGLVGRAFEGPGLYQGEISPGIQTQVLTGSQQVPGGPTGARMLDEGSRRIMDASEATFGLAMGQDAAAYSRLLPSGSGVPPGLWDVPLPGGTITNAQMKALAARFPNIGDMAVIPIPGGVRLGYMDPATKQEITKMLGGSVSESGVGLDTNLASNFLPNDWKIKSAGQGYFDPIRTIGTEKFDAFAPGMFEKIRKADAMFRKATGGRFTMSQMLDEARAAVAGGGWADLAKLATKYGIPVTLLVAGLGELGIQVPPPKEPG